MTMAELTTDEKILNAITEVNQLIKGSSQELSYLTTYAKVLKTNLFIKPVNQKRSRSPKVLFTLFKNAFLCYVHNFGRGRADDLDVKPLFPNKC